MARELTICFYTVIAVFTIWLSMQVRDEYFCLDRSSKGRHQNRILLFAIFIILFLTSALRFEVGNDYYNYAVTAHEVYYNGYVVTEVGFNYLVKVVYNLFGGEYYEIVFAIFAFATLVIFLKAMYEQGDIFYEVFFLFMTFGLYFQTFNTMRYYFALAVAFYSMRYVLRKDWLRFVLLIGIASLFHKSVLIVIPVYFLATLDWNKWVIIGITLLGAICLCLKSPLLKLALYLYPSYRDTIYLEGGTSISSIIRGVAILGFMIYIFYSCNVEEQAKDELLIYSKLNFLSVIAYVFFSFLPVITRIGYYLSIFTILLIPKLINQIKQEKRARKARYIVIIACVIYFIVFLLTADKDGVGLMPYKTWLFNERYNIK